MKELFSIYKNLNEAQLQKLTDIAQTKKIEDDTLILEKDQKNSLLYILKTGEAHILDKDPHTPQNNLAILGTGCSFGAVSSFRSKKTIADVRIKKGSIVDIINIDKIDKKSALYHILKENVTDEFVNEVQKINQDLLHKYSDEMKFSLFLQILLISLSLGMMFSSFSITFLMKPDLVWI
jgi:CRP-like cAMP-binding protein